MCKFLENLIFFGGGGGLQVNYAEHREIFLHENKC